MALGTLGTTRGPIRCPRIGHSSWLRSLSEFLPTTNIRALAFELPLAVYELLDIPDLVAERGGRVQLYTMVE